jgi:hypothetical protein
MERENEKGFAQKILKGKSSTGSENARTKLYVTLVLVVIVSRRHE